MVILSVSVLTNKGKRMKYLFTCINEPLNNIICIYVDQMLVLMARQYITISRFRIEGLIADFRKLVCTPNTFEDTRISKQHTFVESDEIRYIYQFIDKLYLVLITNIQSNMLQNLATLRKIANLVEYTTIVQYDVLPSLLKKYDVTKVNQHIHKQICFQY